MYAYYCTIRRVINGDTVDCDIDLGFRLIHRVHVRLTGINAPELSQPQGQQAKQFLESLILTGTPRCIVRTALPREFDKYGRVLGIFERDGPGQSGHQTINDMMVSAGFATKI